MAPCHLPVELKTWISPLADALHARVAKRLRPMFLGLLFARGRRTVAEWLRAAGLGKDFRLYYYFLGSLGRNVNLIAVRLLQLAMDHIVPGERLLFAIDDTPTARYGPQVEGAGIHHDPTPGPAGGQFLYGHVWVTLAWIVAHPLWGTIGLPLLAYLYVRQKNIGLVRRWYGVKFEAGAGGTDDPLVGVVAETHGKNVVAGHGWRLRQAAGAESRVGVGRRGREPTAQRRRLVECADAAACRSETPARPPGDLWERQDQLGKTRRSSSRLDKGNVDAVRKNRDQDLQDISGDLSSGRGTHPRSPGQGDRGLGRLLLH